MTVPKTWKPDAQVAEFQTKIGNPPKAVPVVPEVMSVLANYAQITQETAEFREAFLRLDLPDIAQEGIDVIYSMLGLLLAFGVPIRACFNEIHAANMRKTFAEGKALKPSDWAPPDIVSILREYGWKGERSTGMVQYTGRYLLVSKESRNVLTMGGYTFPSPERARAYLAANTYRADDYVVAQLAPVTEE